MKKILLLTILMVTLFGCSKEQKEDTQKVFIANSSSFTWYETLVNVYNNETGKTTTYTPSESTVEKYHSITASRVVGNQKIRDLKDGDYFYIICRNEKNKILTSNKIQIIDNRAKVFDVDFPYIDLP